MCCMFTTFRHEACRITNTQSSCYNSLYTLVQRTLKEVEFISTVQDTEFCVLLTVHLGTVFVNNQLDVQLFFLYVYFCSLYMLRAAMCPLSGELIVSIRHLVYVTLYRWPFSVQVWMRLLCSFIQTCTLNGHLYRVTYTRCRIDTINSPDDGHMAARSM